MRSGPPPTVLYADRDPEGLFRSPPPETPFRVEAVSTASASVERIEAGGVDCVVSGSRLADATWREFLERVRAVDSDVPFLLVVEDAEELDGAFEASISDYVIASAPAATRAAVERVRAAIDGASRDADSDDADPADDDIDSGRAEIERRFEAMFEDPDSLIGLLAPDGTVRRVNRTALEFIDADPEDVEGVPFWRTGWWDHSPQHRQQLREWIERAADGETVYYDADHVSADGSPVIVDGTIRPVTTADGDVQSLLVRGSDVTERRRIREELRRSERSLRTLYEVTSDPDRSFEEKLNRILEIGRERLDLSLGYLTRIDDGVQEIVAASGDHVELEPGATAPLSEAYCEATVTSDELVGAESTADADWVDSASRSRFGFACYLGGKILVNDELYGTFCFADDEPRKRSFTDSERTFVELLSQWASHELERERRQRELRRANEQLERFTGVVSHDLRNPLSVAMGHLEFVRQTADDRHVDEIERSLERIDDLIDDLLTLARQGDAVGETRRVALDAVARDAWETVDTAEAGFEIGDLPTVEADESRLRQLLENLFRNAVEHGSTTPDSPPSRQDAVDHGPDDVTVRIGGLDGGFHVEDDGPGIPPDERERVFEQGHTTSRDGTGFGLAIVGQIVSAHGWEIDLGESADGGARFEIGGVATATPIR